MSDKIIIVRPPRQCKSKSDAVQMWRSGHMFDVLYNSCPPYGQCNNQDFDARVEIEIRWNYPKSLTDFVIIHN